MKCSLIVSPGEVIETAPEYHQLGYEIELWPSTQNLTTLTDTREEEWIPFLSRHPATAERHHVRSLRASFIRMLRFSGDDDDDDDDMTIFGESDACPVITADRVAEALQRELAEHPETDVFRLFHHAEWNPPENTGNDTPILFEQFQTGNKDANTPYVWGTHALVIPRKSREKVAQIFADYRLPVDIALEAANSNGELNIRTASLNLFYQNPRTFQPNDRKIAACLASYKRLPDLQRQIWAMMDQDYPHLHLFVAVKGIPESTFRKTLLPQFEHFIQEGRLTMRVFPNKNQLSNFLDTIRDLNLSKYDLLAKIDDDDIYDRDYFRMVNEFHRFLPSNFSSYYHGLGNYISDRGGCPMAEPGHFWCFGPTMVFSTSVIEKLQACEKKPDQIGAISPRAGQGGYGFTEDHLMHIIMEETGSCNRFRYIHCKGGSGNLMICRNNASVMRGGLVPSDFRQKNGCISNNEENYERIVEVRHPAWHDLVRIMSGRASRSSGFDSANVLGLSDSEFILNWDNWGPERFIKQETGIFTLAP